jgi:hypothetical protein
LNRVAAGRLAVWLQRPSINGRGRRDRCPRQESNLVSDLRGVVCESGTLRGRVQDKYTIPRPGIGPGLAASKTAVRPTHSRGFSTPLDRRARPREMPSPGVEPGLRPSEGRVRFRHTPRADVGKMHHQQGRKDSNPVREFWRLAALPGAHPYHNPGYSAGVEPGASRFTFSRASVTPRTPSPRPAPIAEGRSGRGGSRTRKARRSPAFQAGPVAARVALPFGRFQEILAEWSRVDSNHRSSPRQRDVLAARRRDPIKPDSDDAPARTRTRNTSLEARHDAPFHHRGLNLIESEEASMTPRPGLEPGTPR